MTVKSFSSVVSTVLPFLLLRSKLGLSEGEKSQQTGRPVLIRGTQELFPYMP